MTPGLFARAEVQPGGAALVLHYQVHNPFAIPVLLFDRRWDLDRGAMDRGWMEVFLEGTLALLVRGHIPPPEGTLAGEYPVPYGRRLEPGATHVTTVTIPLPLAEGSLWLALQRPPLPAEEAREVRVDRVELRLGWCLLQNPAGLPDESREPQEIDGERLYWLDASIIAAAQQTVVAAVATVPITARRFAGGAG